MRNLRVLRIQHNIRLRHIPEKNIKKTNWYSIISFASASFLTISETMPFLSNESNGILHAFNKIIKEYKTIG